MRILGAAAVAIAVLSAAPVSRSHQPQRNDPPEWTERVAPFRVVGNICYVGTADLASYLITSSNGRRIG